MRILGIDLGAKSIGVAVSDELGLTAQGVKTIRRKGMKRDLEELELLILKYGVEGLVVGLPRNMNGSLGPAAQKTLRFAEKLEAFDLPITMEDERLTTVIAEQVLIEGDVRRSKRKQVIDQVAAALILQAYLDRVAREREDEA